MPLLGIEPQERVFAAEGVKTSYHYATETVRDEAAGGAGTSE